MAVETLWNAVLKCSDHLLASLGVSYQMLVRSEIRAVTRHRRSRHPSRLTVRIVVSLEKLLDLAYARLHNDSVASRRNRGFVGETLLVKPIQDEIFGFILGSDYAVNDILRDVLAIEFVPRSRNLFSWT